MIACGAGLQACKHSRPKGLRYILIALLACAPAAFAQDAGRGGDAPPAPRNLQVLPKGSSQQDVLAVMQQFTRGLGVACTYCHVEQTAPLLTVEEQQAAQAAAAANPQQAGRGRGRGRGRGGPQMDFAADDRWQKQIARAMLAMTNDINLKIDAAVHAKPATGQPRDVVHVQCMTCHRGVTNPQQLSDLLRQTMLGKGEGAAVAEYRELRQRYLDTGAYDFREPVLLELGRESLATHKPDDALAWLQLNVEFYPQSAASYVELAKAHIVKRDRDSAIADLTKALAVDPANADAKRQLRALGK
jgi:tetratricopeptide (TPR) repeat protein